MRFEDIKIDLRFVSKSIANRFINKDLITLEELFRDYQDVIDELEETKED